jgi:xanthosine utilization system XapX-like protein
MSIHSTVMVISSLAPLIVALVGIISNSKLIGYRIDQLEKKVTKHNNIVERTYKLESDMETVWKRYDDMKQDIDRIEDKK